MAIHRDRDGRIHELDDSAEKPTRLIKRDAAKQEQPELEPAPELPGKTNDRTHLFRAPEGAGGSADDAMQNPVVGWVVIIAGPGRGRALTLGYGMNSIARGSQSRVRLDFGDKQISRDDHALISYDPRGRRFYLQHGGGTNLTYLNEQPVLTPTELRGGEVILLGQTQLRFVPFCGAAFDWQDGDPC
jgi:pSer/pThr/pTyr-binding forkhead associated (FHA) protein